MCLDLHPSKGRAVVAALDGGKMTSDAGALLGATDRTIGLVKRFAECFTDSRAPDLIEHEVRTLIGQRVFALALGYEDLVDHDELRHDPTMAVLTGKLSAGRKDCAPLAGKSCLDCRFSECHPAFGRGPRQRRSWPSITLRLPRAFGDASFPFASL